MYVHCYLLYMLNFVILAADSLSVKMEFLVDSGMQLAYDAIKKTTDAVNEKTTENVAERTTESVQKSLNALDSQLHRIDTEVKHLPEGTYKSALCHIHKALMILKNHAALDMSSDFDPSTGDSVYVGVEKEGLPEATIQLIDAAYHNAYASFNNAENFPPLKRITAMQVAILCIGLQHINEPTIILAEWEKCVKDVYADDAMVQAIRKNLSEGSLPKDFVSRNKPEAKAFLNFARDLLVQTVVLVARARVEENVANGLINQVVRPAKFDKETRILWAQKLNFIREGHELKTENMGMPSDGCAALPNGGVVISTENDILIKYSRNFEIINTKPGGFYSLVFDPFRKCLWGFSKHKDRKWLSGSKKRKDTLEALDLIELKPTGLKIDAPEIPFSTSFVCWQISVTASGWIVIAGQYLSTADTETMEPLIFAKHSLEDMGWRQIRSHPDMVGKVITDISVRDRSPKESKSNTLMALALEGELYIIYAILTVDKCKIDNCVVLSPDLFQDVISCAFDDKGRLVVVVRCDTQSRCSIKIVDAEKKLVSKHSIESNVSGLWVAAVQHAIWAPTLTGNICQYDYFIF